MKFIVGRSVPVAGGRAHPVLAALLLAALLAAPTSPAVAEDGILPAGMLPGGTQIFFTPYLWLSGIDATINTPIARASTVTADVSAIDVLSHLNAVPWMSAIEIRNGPLGLLGDALHVPVGTGLKTRDIAFSGGNANLITDSGTALLIYRVFAAPGQYGDLGLGFRSWGFTANLTLNPGALPAASSTRAASWVDPLIGGRYHIDLPNGFGLTAYGDVGGFGVGAHSDWQLMGTVDYAPTSWLNLHLDTAASTSTTQRAAASTSASTST